MNWTIAEARKRFAELIQAAARRPQPIYRRDKLVAALINARLYREFEDWRKHRHEKSIAEAFAEYRTIADEEDFELEIPPRRDRDVHWPE